MKKYIYKLAKEYIFCSNCGERKNIYSGVSLRKDSYIMDIVELIKIIFLGIVEGITEWLPISSTGHMILVDAFLKLNVTEAFKEMFFVVIQLGAILAVAVSFFNKLNPFSPKKSKEEKKDTWLLIAKVILACIPAGVIGILFDDKLNEIFYNWQTVAIMLIVYGVFFILIEVWNKKKGKESAIKTVTDITFTTAFLIGLAQVLSLIPGTSRSGATILGAMLLGASRIAATEFTFFLAIPVMLGASLVKLLKYFMEVGFGFAGNEIVTLVVGLVTAFVVSMVSIKFLVNFVKKNDFKVFGYYRIVLGIIVIVCGALGVLAV